MAQIFSITFNFLFGMGIKMLKFESKFIEIVPKCPIDNKPALVYRVAWCQIGNKPLTE